SPPRPRRPPRPRAGIKVLASCSSESSTISDLEGWGPTLRSAATPKRTTITEDTREPGGNARLSLFDRVSDAIDEVEDLPGDTRVHGPEREQLRHVIVPEALAISRHDAAFDDEFAEQLRCGREVA